MSVRVDKYFGWTIELKKELNCNDFEFYNNFIENHQNLNQYGKGVMPNEIKLILNGMSGLFARLIYILSVSYDVAWVDEDNDVVPESTFKELNEIYVQLTGQELQKEQVKLKEWHNWG